MFESSPLFAGGKRGNLGGWEHSLRKRQDVRMAAAPLRPRRPYKFCTDGLPEDVCSPLPNLNSPTRTGCETWAPPCLESADSKDSALTRTNSCN